jgi:hypothetical protein
MYHVGAFIYTKHMAIYFSQIIYFPTQHAKAMQEYVHSMILTYDTDETGKLPKIAL